MAETASRTFIIMNLKRREFSKLVNVSITSNWGIRKILGCKQKDFGDPWSSWAWSGDGCSWNAFSLAQATNFTIFYCFFVDMQICSNIYFASDPCLRIEKLIKFKFLIFFLIKFIHKPYFNQSKFKIKLKLVCILCYPKTN